MTFSYFDILSHREQTTFLQKGVFICEWRDESLMVQLYFIETFYVEVYGNSTNEISLFMWPFVDKRRLERWLDNVSLRDLEGVL